MKNPKPETSFRNCCQCLPLMVKLLMRRMWLTLWKQLILYYQRHENLSWHQRSKQGFWWSDSGQNLFWNIGNPVDIDATRKTSRGLGHLWRITFWKCRKSIWRTEEICKVSSWKIKDVKIDWREGACKSWRDGTFYQSKKSCDVCCWLFYGDVKNEHSWKINSSKKPWN